jgi:hypothetical protein
MVLIHAKTNFIKAMPVKKNLFEAFVLGRTFKANVLVLAKDKEHAKSLVKKIYPYSSITINEFDKEVIQ